MPSEPIASEKVSFERKIFFLDLKENQRGRFLKITEDVGGRRDTIMLPAPAFRDLHLEYAVSDLQRPLTQGPHTIFRFEASQIQALMAYLKTLHR